MTTTTGASTGRLGPLRHPAFRWLAAAVTIDHFGSALTPVALAFAVLDLGGTATQLGLVVAAYALAEVLTTLFGGVLGDRLSRRVMLEGTTTVAAVVQGVTAFALLAGWASLPLLAGLGVVAGVVGALASPSSMAITPLTVPPDKLAAAISLRRIGVSAAMVAGFAAAGSLVALYGSGVAVAVDAGTFAVAAFCFSRMRIDEPAREPTNLGVTALVADLRVGAREVFRHTWLWVLIGQAMLYHLAYGGAQGVLGPIVVGDRFGRAAWGWSLALLMLGFVVGGLVSLVWRPRHALVTGVAALALTGCFPVAMALSPTLSGVLVGAFLHGLGLELFSVWWDLSIQQNVPEDRLSRVYSFDSVGSFVARPLGLALTGPVAAVVGEHTWLIVVGVVMSGSSLLATSVPAVRRLVRRDPDPAPVG